MHGDCYITVIIANCDLRCHKQAHVPRGEDQCLGSGSRRHVHRPPGVRPDRLTSVEVRQRWMGKSIDWSESFNLYVKHKVPIPLLKTFKNLPKSKILLDLNNIFYSIFLSINSIIHLYFILKLSHLPGSWWQSGGSPFKPHLRTPRISQLWGPLDEGTHFVRQSKTDQQDQWQWTGGQFI